MAYQTREQLLEEIQGMKEALESILDLTNDPEITEIVEDVLDLDDGDDSEDTEEGEEE